MRVAPSVRRLGSESRINSYLVEESGRVTMAEVARLVRATAAVV